MQLHTDRFSRRMVCAVFIGVVAVAASGCQRGPVGGDASPPVSGTIFRHRWWNYYARALGHMDRQAYAAARRDIQAALARRDSDQRMARTYGMHFVDYFPHRELGILCWRTGDLPKAEQALQRSIADAPSAKARYYLDLVRKARIRQGGVPADPPALRLNFPGDRYLRAKPLRAVAGPSLASPSGPAEHYWTRQDPVRVRGRARDPNYVASVCVAGVPLFQEGAQAQLHFRHDLRLSQGAHGIAVTATNLAGRTAVRKVVIHVDRQAPWVIVKRIALTDRGIALQGSLTDDIGAAALTINGIHVPIGPGRQATFRHQVGAGADRIAFEAADRLGNTVTLAVGRRSLLAAAGQRPLVAGIGLPALGRSRDRTGPVIHLADWQASQTVYMDQAVLSGVVRDQGQVVRLLINNEPVLPQSGTMVIFTHCLRLAKGVNRIVLEARDAAGNRTLKTIRIDRQVPKVRMLNQRLRLSVFAFDRKGEISSLSLAFQDNFIHQLVQQHRFQLIERSELEHILQEQKISRTRLIDRSTAVRLGRLAAAQVIVGGALVETRSGIEVIGRVIDSETSEVLATADAYTETGGLAGLQALARVLALKIHREFPLVQGRVVNTDKDIIFTDLGSPKIRAQRHILVFREKPVHRFRTGDILGEDCQVLGTARVIQAGPQLSKARLRSGDATNIHPQQKVMTR